MVPPSKYTPDLPFSLEQIILKCTQKSVDRRYNNLSEVIEDLKHSLVDPNGTFVQLAPLSSHAQTVRISQEELDAIKEGKTEAQDKPYQEQPVIYDDDDEDEYEDDDEDDEGGISSKLEKAMTIGGFIIGAIIICILIYFIGTAAGIFKFGSDKKKEPQQIEENQDNQDDETSDDEDMVEVPELRGKTVAEAEEALKDTGIGLKK